MGIQSAVLVDGRHDEPVPVPPETAEYGEREWVEWDWTGTGRRSAERYEQTEV